MAKTKIAALVSGRGSNLQALIDACAEPDFPAEIALVLSNKAGARGLERARDAGLETKFIDHTLFDDREAYEREVDAALREAGAKFVCLAGFMRILTPWFVDKWKNQLLNIHPSLLPAFKGVHTHERAIETGVRIHGATVHFVRPEMDDGPIIGQAAVPVLPDDDPDTLAARVLEAEHKLYPACVRLVVEGKARVTRERVRMEAAVAAEAGLTLFNPQT
ncbi:phosphoribosylglycinamide formyltransferase [Marinicauda salina]|uniref:Phosphoribosylglycinamide formyltransferase n=1 Tax=Marinicauda salina TaxID=2135793 RepID=A0A2U2BTJ8_9PROT|nr:phosphoribosylglycinamide formyltransferase [Marinicauda salina]PWE17331.1 phosphoribosylglycinamide formyltransferase [Marinicauda salina]